jgi:hypothetical protein
MKRYNKEAVKIKDMVGVEHMSYAVLEQAVLDLKALERAGLVVDAKPVKPWPTGVLRVCQPKWYCTEAEVKRLIYFFTGGAFKEWLVGLGSTLDADAAISRLGLHTTNGLHH